MLVGESTENAEDFDIVFHVPPDSKNLVVLANTMETTETFANRTKILWREFHLNSPE
jgi:hypothetical protein